MIAVAFLYTSKSPLRRQTCGNHSHRQAARLICSSHVACLSHPRTVSAPRKYDKHLPYINPQFNMKHLVPFTWQGLVQPYLLTHLLCQIVPTPSTSRISSIMISPLPPTTSSASSLQWATSEIPPTSQQQRSKVGTMGAPIHAACNYSTVNSTNLTLLSGW